MPRLGHKTVLSLPGRTRDGRFVLKTPTADLVRQLGRERPRSATARPDSVTGSCLLPRQNPLHGEAVPVGPLARLEALSSHALR